MRPAAEGLEDRKLLYATLGGQWAFASRVTYSFVPDGTDVGGIPSAWYQRMNQLGFTETTWKDQFRRAAASWAAVSDLDLVEVPDDGSAFSVSGNQQGDGRFGDIRIAATPQGAGVLGLAFYPPPFNGGTLAGDIVMNTSSLWAIQSTYDVQTVAVHEFGHALGMDHSHISTAVMHATYSSVRQNLSSDDTSGIRSLYQARAADPFEGALNNNVHQRATSLNGYLDGLAQVRLATPEMTTASDADWYSVTVPGSTSGTLQVTMQSSGLSSLSPKLQVLNGALQLQGLQASTAFGATVSVTVPNVVPGQVYYIRAMPAVSGPAGVGSYGLLVNLGASPISPIAPPNTVVPEQPNQGGGGSDLADSEDRPGLGDERGATRANAEKPQHPEQGQPHVIRLGTIRGYGQYLTVDELLPAPAAACNGSQAAPEPMVLIGLPPESTPVLALRMRRGAVTRPVGAAAVDAALAAWFGG